MAVTALLEYLVLTAGYCILSELRNRSIDAVSMSYFLKQSTARSLRGVVIMLTDCVRA